MIDTNTVNFAMNKLSAAIGSALPTMGNVSAAYVKFVVTQQICYAIGLFLGVVIPALLWIPVYFKAKRDEEFDDPGFAVPTIALAAVFLICLVCFIGQMIDVVLALSNPEMFTVNNIVRAARGGK